MIFSVVLHGTYLEPIEVQNAMTLELARRATHALKIEQFVRYVRDLVLRGLSF